MKVHIAYLTTHAGRVICSSNLLQRIEHFGSKNFIIQLCKLCGFETAKQIETSKEWQQHTVATVFLVMPTFLIILITLFIHCNTKYVIIY